MPASAKPTLPSSNLDFIRAFLSAVLLLILSASILTTAYLFYFSHSSLANNSPFQPKTKPVSFAAKDLDLAVGRGDHSEKALIVTQLTENDRRAIVSSGPVSIEAAHYPFLRFHINNLHQGLDLHFFWRSLNNPQQIDTARLYWEGDGSTYFNLSKNNTWKGHISEIGLLIYDNLRNKKLEIKELALLPYSPQTVLSTTWSEWNAFKGWSQKTINFVTGTAPKSLISPTLATIAWCALALLIYIGYEIIRALRYNIKPQFSIVTAASILLIGWVSLDVKWQLELFKKLEDTHYRYAGKSSEEKHLAADDSQLYSYTQRLKKDILPDKPARIFILHSSSGHNYQRLRAQYHLLPHNVYNFGKYPKVQYLLADDWLLVLGKIKGMLYDDENNYLTWKNSRLAHVKVRDRSPLGLLLQLEKTTHLERCDPDNPNLENAFTIGVHNYDCSTETPITISGLYTQPGTVINLSSPVITLTPNTRIIEGTEFNAISEKPCTISPDCTLPPTSDNNGSNE